jgi:MFS family permease
MAAAPDLAYASPAGRWVLFTTVLGSALASVDLTVINLALPTIGRDLHADWSGLNWTVNAYALTLSALILLRGSLGDLLGRRRIYVIGVPWFAIASLASGSGSRARVAPRPRSRPARAGG